VLFFKVAHYLPFLVPDLVPFLTGLGLCVVPFLVPLLHGIFNPILEIS
jgi:hypothetical protein